VHTVGVAGRKVFGPAEEAEADPVRGDDDLRRTATWYTGEQLTAYAVCKAMPSQMVSTRPSVMPHSSRNRAAKSATATLEALVAAGGRGRPHVVEDTDQEGRLDVVVLARPLPACSAAALASRSCAHCGCAGRALACG
jgi:hypothetical protein